VNVRSHRADGQNILYGDGHVDWSATPFAGPYRDNVYNADRPVDTSGAPKDQYDTVLLPTDDDAGSAAPAIQREAERKQFPALTSPLVGGKPAAESHFRPSQLTAADAGVDEKVEPRPMRRSPDRRAPGQTTPESPPASGMQGQQQGGQGNGSGAAPAPQPPATGQDVATAATSGRKIIRNGQMEFEVDGFDSAAARVTRIANEEGGFVSTTNSDRLPNGHVRGMLVLRVAPEH